MALKDSRGAESKTLGFVTASWGVVLVKYMTAEMTILGVTVPDMSTGEFGAAVTLILGIWLGREWVDTKRGAS